MKIMHFCLSCFYIDNYNYQENILPKLNSQDGHDVIIVASTETFIDNKKLGYIKSGNFKTKENVELIRLDYLKILPRFIMNKIRLYKGVKVILDEFKPDIIYFHGLAAFELINITKYVKSNPDVKFYLDSHEDANNSGTNFISKYILHRILYKFVINVTKAYFDCVFYISLEVKDFIQANYGYQGKSLFLPLGGEIIDDNEYNTKRNNFRNKYSIESEDIVYFHSGKLDITKKTLELITSYNESKTLKKLFIAGSVSEEIKNDFNELIMLNENIRFLGWLNADEISEVFCGSDIYLQPGTQSVSMQQALCSRCLVALYPYPSHDYLLNENYFKLRDSNDMITFFQDIDNRKYDLIGLGSKCIEIAKSLLDYKKQSRKYLSDFNY